MFNQWWGNCETHKQTRMTYNMFFMAFRSTLQVKDDIALKCNWHFILHCSSLPHYSYLCCIVIRKATNNSFTLGQLISVFQHYLFIYDQHESNAQESLVTCGHCLITFWWFNFWTFRGIYLNMIVKVSTAYMVCTVPCKTQIGDRKLIKKAV